jgi:hypothetical protein
MVNIMLAHRCTVLSAKGQQQCAPGMIACRDMYSDILQALAMSNIYSHVTELLQCLWNKDQTHQTY